MEDLDYALIGRMGGEDQGTLLFAAPNDDHAIGFAHGILVERIDQLGRPYVALGITHRIERRDALSAWEADKYPGQPIEDALIGTWTAIPMEEVFCLEWCGVDPERGDEGGAPEG
jgi:hypothetical protein